MILSFPPIESEKTTYQTLIDNLKKDAPYVNEIYLKCKETEDTVLNLADLDSEKGIERRAIIAHPLFDKDRKFRGAVIWESELANSFWNGMIPESI